MIYTLIASTVCESAASRENSWWSTPTTMSNSSFVRSFVRSLSVGSDGMGWDGMGCERLNTNCNESIQLFRKLVAGQPNDRVLSKPLKGGTSVQHPIRIQRDGPGCPQSDPRFRSTRYICIHEHHEHTVKQHPYFPRRDS
jgi:hypothetical protein